MISVGTRLTDFATGSQSVFENDTVRFASLNVVDADTRKQGAVGILADARLGLAALTAALDGHSSGASWRDTVTAAKADWAPIRAAALDPDVAFSRKEHPDAPVTDAVLTQAQLVGLLQEHARSGDTIIAAAGSAPGDLQKVWDATDNRHCHLEFGFSCMGYELPAAMGVRLAEGDNGSRITTFIGDGTYLMAPTELLTAAQERLDVTIMVSENHGYQVIHRLQMNRNGREFGNEFRYRTDGDIMDATAGGKAPRLDGDYLQVDLCKIAEGLGATAIRATTAAEVRQALADTRDTRGPVVLVVPTVPHVDLPGGDVWWDVARRSVRPGMGTGTTRQIRTGPRRTKVVRMTNSTPIAGALWAQHGKHIQRGSPVRSGPQHIHLKTGKAEIQVSTTNRHIGAGLISVGWMGQLHTRAYRNVPIVYPEFGITPELVIAADTAPDRVEFARDVLGYSRGTTDYREVLADPEVDVVSICAPNFLHAEIGVAAAEAGKHFWIEKPVGRSWRRPRASMPPRRRRG